MQQLSSSSRARTVAILVLLVPRLAVSEPVQRVLLGVRTLVFVVLPARMLQRPDRVQVRACVYTPSRIFRTHRHTERGSIPGHKPTILPSCLPSLYHERQFALYTDCEARLCQKPSRRYRRAHAPAGSSSAPTPVQVSISTTERTNEIASARDTHLHIPIKVPHSAPLDLHAPDALALHLRRRLHRVPDGGLEDGEEDARADDRVRAEGHEHVREAVDAHGQVRGGVGRPVGVEVAAVAADEGEGELPGRVVPCGCERRGAGRGRSQ